MPDQPILGRPAAIEWVLPAGLLDSTWSGEASSTTSVGGISFALISIQKLYMSISCARRSQNNA